MRKCLTLILGILFFPFGNMNADEKDDIYISSFRYYVTDKRGEHVIDYQIDRNTRFGFCVLHSSTKNRSCSMVLSDEMYNNILDKLLYLGKMEDDINLENIDENDNNNVWCLNFFLYSEDHSSYYIGEKCRLDKKGNVISKDASLKKLMMGLNELIGYLELQINAFNAKYKGPILVHYYNSQGPNGLSGIFVDSNGKRWDQTVAEAYTVSLDGVTMYSYAWEVIDRFDFKFAENEALVREIIDKANATVKLKKYVKPAIREFVTDAAPPDYALTMSDGKRLSTSDDNDYDYHPQDMPKQRYDVDGYVGVYSVINEYIHLDDLIKENYNKIPRKTY